MIVLLFAMEFVSLMLALILATAWNSFGRPRHALTWCAAFVVAAIAWAGNIVLVGACPGDGLLGLAVDILSMMTWALLMIGFRQRAGLPARRRRPLAIGSVVTILLAGAHLAGDRVVSDAIPLLFAASTLAMAAGTVMRGGGRNQAERATITMLLAFALLYLVAGVITLGQGANGFAYPALARALMMLTFPSAFTGTGLFAVFLLAADLADRMGRLAASDPLTGILNRRGFEEAAARALALARRQRQPLTIVLADLDRFKSVNDRYGHAVGDRVLCRFAEHVTGSIRAGDLFGRIGGEEFAMLLVDAAPAEALDVVDRIRIALGEIDIPAGTDVIHVSASFGLTGPSMPDDDLATLIARADSALYQSKMAGRDRVTVAPLPPTLPDELRLLVKAADAALALSGTAAR